MQLLMSFNLVQKFSDIICSLGYRKREAKVMWHPVDAVVDKSPSPQNFLEIQELSIRIL